MNSSQTRQTAQTVGFEAPGITFSWVFKLSKAVDAPKIKPRTITSSLFHLVKGNLDVIEVGAFWWLEWDLTKETMRILSYDVELRARGHIRQDIPYLPSPRSDALPYISISVALVDDEDPIHIYKDYRDDRPTCVTPLYLEKLSSAIKAQVAERETCVFRITVQAGSHIKPPMEVVGETKRVIGAVYRDWQDLHTKHYPFDVCFTFEGSENELWEDSSHLMKFSPYWSSCFTSGFAEGVKQKSADGRAHTHYSLPIKLTMGLNPYDAYRAILTWTRTKTIKFARLQNSNPPALSSAAASGSRHEADECDSLIVYEVCKYIQLDELSDITLNYIKEMVTEENVLHQLFSCPVAWSHDELKDFLLHFVRKERQQKGSKMWDYLKIVHQDLTAGTLPISSDIAASLLIEVFINLG